MAGLEGCSSSAEIPLPVSIAKGSNAVKGWLVLPEGAKTPPGILAHKPRKRSLSRTLGRLSALPNKGREEITAVPARPQLVASGKKPLRAAYTTSLTVHLG